MRSSTNIRPMRLRVVAWRDETSAIRELTSSSKDEFSIKPICLPEVLLAETARSCIKWSDLFRRAPLSTFHFNESWIGVPHEKSSAARSFSD